jgi:glutamate-1-semialdehyde aminotransferase
MTTPDTNASLYERGLQRIPGGVNSPVRAFRSVGGTPYFVARGDGRSVFARTLEEHRRNVQTYLRRGPRDGGSGP